MAVQEQRSWVHVGGSKDKDGYPACNQKSQSTPNDSAYHNKAHCNQYGNQVFLHTRNYHGDQWGQVPQLLSRGDWSPNIWQ